MLVDVASASISNGRMNIKILAYHFCSITTQIVQFNKFEFFPEMSLKLQFHLFDIARIDLKL
jgi:hypothetical protein